MNAVKAVFAATTLLFVACGAPPTNDPTPTGTAVPPATDTAVPPSATHAPTSTPEPSPTQDPLIFRDEFEGELGDGWQWVREESRYWSLTSSPGWLEIIARPGFLSQGNVKNLLLRQAPQGDFELETNLRFQPTGNFQLAGLLIYQSAGDHIVFGRAFCNQPQCTGDGFYLDLFSDSNLSPENFATDASNTDTTQIRLRREGHVYTGYVTTDGAEWTLIGAHRSAMVPMYVGIIAGQAFGSWPKPAYFDYFLVNALQ